MQRKKTRVLICWRTGGKKEERGKIAAASRNDLTVRKGCMRLENCKCILNAIAMIHLTSLIAHARQTFHDVFFTRKTYVRQTWTVWTLDVLALLSLSYIIIRQTITLNRKLKQSTNYCVRNVFCTNKKNIITSEWTELNTMNEWFCTSCIEIIGIFKHFLHWKQKQNQIWMLAKSFGENQPNRRIRWKKVEKCNRKKNPK